MFCARKASDRIPSTVVRCIPEVLAQGEKQSNGHVEEAGKTTREFVRVFKEQIEHRANITLECDDEIVPWMIRWAAMVPSRYLVRRDGRTPYERRRGVIFLYSHSESLSGISDSATRSVRVASSIPSGERAFG